MQNVHLSQRELGLIASLVDTEVPAGLAYTNPDEYARMVQGVVDTVTNRMSSTQFPNTVTGVANQPSQFSMINGPLPNAYGSVQAAPKASQMAQMAVDDYVASRAQGTPRTVGPAMNYANPEYSSASARASWIDPMTEAGAMTLGVGENVHVHGTAPGITPAGEYSLTADNIPSGNIPTPFSPAPPGFEGLLGDIQAHAAAPSYATAYSQVASPPSTSLAATAAQPASVGETLGPSNFDSMRFDIDRTLSPDISNRFARDVAPETAPSTPFGSYESAVPGLGQNLRDQALSFGALPSLSPAEVAAPAPPGVDMSLAPAVGNPFGYDIAPGPLGQTPSVGSYESAVPGLGQNLREQALSFGALPSLPSAPATPSVATPGYVDQQVSTQTTGSVSPNFSAPSPQSGLSPSEFSRTQETQRSLGLSPEQAASVAGTKAQAAAADRGLSNYSKVGTVGGAMLGGMVAGPIGGLLGGLLGKSLGAGGFYPAAPMGFTGVSDPGYGYGSLSDYGRDTYGGSDDFKGAVDSGSAGLW